MKKILKFIKGLIFGFDKQDKRAIQDAIFIVNKMKNLLDSSYMPIWLAIIPGHIDNIIAAKLKEALPKILIGLKLCENGNVREAIQSIRELDPSVKGDFLDALAIQIAVVLADGRLTWSEVKSVMKVVYDAK